jgi:hypothetical protein
MSSKQIETKSRSELLGYVGASEVANIINGLREGRLYIENLSCLKTLCVRSTRSNEYYYKIVKKADGSYGTDISNKKLDDPPEVIAIIDGSLDIYMKRADGNYECKYIVKHKGVYAI